MNKKFTRLRDYLRHILDAIVRIEHYVEDLDKVSFLENELIQDAVIRNLEVIGEASNNINKHYPDFVQKHTDLPLSTAYEMRNAISHGYFKIDFEVIWKTIERDLPEFEIAIRLLLDAEM